MHQRDLPGGRSGKRRYLPESHHAISGWSGFLAKRRAVAGPLPLGRSLCGVVVGIGFGGLTGLLFFHSLSLGGVLGALGGLGGLGVFYLNWQTKRRAAFLEGFRVLLVDLLLYLRAGRSMENAFEHILEAIDRSLYPELYALLRQMMLKLRTGESLERSLMELSKACGLEEVEAFARAVFVAKRGEGNVNRIMENTVQEIKGRLDMEKEITLLFAQKKLESKIVALMPLGLFAMLNLLAPDYLSVLYEIPAGQVLLWISLGLMLLGVALSLWIMRVEY